MARPTWKYEDEAIRLGCRVVAGFDEVGRGSLAGPVVAAAVVLDRRRRIRGINDSKLLTPAQREKTGRAILDGAVAVGLGASEPGEVDRINVYQATLAAMGRALGALEAEGVHVDCLLIDALKLPGIRKRQVSLIGGDRLSFSIAAASIVAKVVRDRVMDHYSETYPEFGFSSNRGYGTPGHLVALGRIGPCPIHRLTFRSVAAAEQMTLSFQL